MEELIWRKGAGCERSAKLVADTIKQSDTIKPSDTNKPAANGIKPTANEFMQDGFRQVSNKREEANHKLNDRYLVGQATKNPFMPNNNYVNDLENQLNFMTPQKGC